MAICSVRDHGRSRASRTVVLAAAPGMARRHRDEDQGDPVRVGPQSSRRPQRLASDPTPPRRSARQGAHGSREGRAPPVPARSPQRTAEELQPETSSKPVPPRKKQHAARRTVLHSRSIGRASAGRSAASGRRRSDAGRSDSRVSACQPEHRTPSSLAQTIPRHAALAEADDSTSLPPYSYLTGVAVTNHPSSR
jgi:hypothetical protein